MFRLLRVFSNVFKVRGLHDLEPCQENPYTLQNIMLKRLGA
jgi:hypothetical protein